MRFCPFGLGEAAFVDQLNSKTRAQTFVFALILSGQELYVLSIRSDFFSKCTEGSLFFYLCPVF